MNTHIGINLKLVLFVLIACQIYYVGAQVMTLSLDRTEAVCNQPTTLKCLIDPFNKTYATWNRNGSAVSQCSDAGLCFDSSKTIEGVTYNFTGNGSGIFMSVNSLPYAENYITWRCIRGSVSLTYQFSVKCPASSSRGSIGGLSIVEIFCIFLGVFAVRIYRIT